MSLITLDSFRWASSSSFSAALLRGPRLGQPPAVTGGSQRRMSSGGTNDPATDPRSVTFASQAESSLRFRRQAEP